MQENRNFIRMLKNVNLVYLGSRCLLLIDISYLSRFWTQFEAWLSLRTPTQDGLLDNPNILERCDMICLHNATENTKQQLLDMWATCSPERAFEILRRPDVTVTSMNDKKVQLRKITKLDADVRAVFAGTRAQQMASASPPATAASPAAAFAAVFAAAPTPELDA